MHAPTLFTGSLHASWCNLLDACHAATIATELSYTELSRRLGPQAMRTADVGSFVEVLARHYQGGGDAELALRRRAADGYAAVGFGEPMNAMRWLARLVSAAPALRGVTVQRRPVLSLRAGETRTRLHDDSGWVELADVVDAANALLRSRSEERFVPILSTRWSEAYARVSLGGAWALDAVGLLEPDWPSAFERIRVRRAA